MARNPFLTRLLEATNAHDVEAITACFGADYVNETPCHPARGFTGNEQVRRNWTGILAGVPDLVAEVRDEAEHGDQVWSEWEMRGTRRDGSPHLMRGVLIFRVDGDLARSCRFYLEPVVDDGVDTDAVVARISAGAS